MIKSLSAAIVWLALQADEYVSDKKYEMRDLIHTVFDFYHTEKAKVKTESESADASSNPPDNKASKYDELSYNQRAFQLEKQQMYLLRLLNFNLLPKDSILPSNILLHWSKCLFDFRIRQDTPKNSIVVDKFNTVLFTIYTDSLRIRHVG